MSKGSIFNRIVSESNEVIANPEKTRFILYTLFISTILIFGIETLVMEVLEFQLAISERTVVFLDGILLVVSLFPLNYLLIVRPMAKKIEQHHRTNLELLKSHEITERFFSINDILIAYMDAEFNFIRVNWAYADADQRIPGDYVGKNHFDLFPNEENREIFETVVKTGRAYNVIEKPFEYVHNMERGVTYWDWSLLPIKDPTGKVIALMLALNDVTVRKQAQIAKEESERRFHAIFDQAFQHFCLLDCEGRNQLTNQTALDFTGTTQEEILGKPLWQLPWWDTPEDREQIEAGIGEAAKGMVVQCEHRVRSAAGEQVTLDTSIKPLHNDQGEPLMLIYEGRDITERIRAEKALIHSEEEIKRLYQAEASAHHLAEALRSAAVALSSSLDSDTVFENLLDHLEKVVPYSSAHINLLENEDQLIVRLARGEENWEPQARLLGKRFNINDLPFLEPLLNDSQILSVPDTLLHPGAEFLLNDQHVLSWLGIPLLAGEHVVGVCLLEHRYPGFFTDDHVQWACALTSQAVVAIQNAWLFEQVRDGRAQLQALSRRLVDVQESERQHISRELHDEAGQSLTSLLVGLRLLERDNHDPQAVVARCEELKEITDDVLENLHRLAVDLRPASLDHVGLVAALRQYTEMISDQHRMAVQFETIGKIERLPEEMETAVYRIVQEALTNVVKHAQATRVDILVERRGERLIVIVEDNGVGFDPLLPTINQLGLLGMRERASMLGGSISIESTPGKGTIVLMESPCQSEY